MVADKQNTLVLVGLSLEAENSFSHTLPVWCECSAEAGLVGTLALVHTMVRISSCPGGLVYTLALVRTIHALVETACSGGLVYKVLVRICSGAAGGEVALVYSHLPPSSHTGFRPDDSAPVIRVLIDAINIMLADLNILITDLNILIIAVCCFNNVLRLIAFMRSSLPLLRWQLKGSSLQSFLMAAFLLLGLTLPLKSSMHSTSSASQAEQHCNALRVLALKKLVLLLRAPLQKFIRELISASAKGNSVLLLFLLTAPPIVVTPSPLCPLFLSVIRSNIWMVSDVSVLTHISDRYDELCGLHGWTLWLASPLGRLQQPYFMIRVVVTLSLCYKTVWLTSLLL